MYKLSYIHFFIISSLIHLGYCQQTWTIILTIPWIQICFLGSQSDAKNMWHFPFKPDALRRSKLSFLLNINWNAYKDYNYTYYTYDATNTYNQLQ